MKDPHTISWIPLAFVLTVMGKGALPAQDWQTVDDFAMGSGNAEAHGIATDTLGGVYVVGTANGHGIVRYSADDGSNWITRDDFVNDSASYNAFNAVMVDNQGSVFVGGGSGGYWDGHWLIRRSIDQGVTWETVDDFWRPAFPPSVEGIDAAVYSLCSDGQGRVYASGPAEHTGCSCYPEWLVRGSSIGGTNWDAKLEGPGGYVAVRQITCANQDVYVTGAGDGLPLVGLILRSTDHGATWTPVFRATGDVHNAITADSAGNLYTAGYSVTSTSIVWLVRQAAPGGTNWTTLDNLTYANLAAKQAFASSIAVDAGENLCVTGQLRESAMIHGTNNVTYGALVTWFTRQYSATSGQWSTTDLFSYSTNMNGSANGVAFAPFGSLFAVGYGTSDSGQRRWVVRKRAAPQPLAQARALESEVNDLIARSAIARERARVLLAILDRIVALMGQGESASVCNSLTTFSKIVQQFVEHGALAPSDGQLLINGIDNLRLLLGCPNRWPN